MRHKYDEDIKKCLEYVLSKCQMGDWFVLYQLSKNCNPYFFREFIKEFAIELKLRPKRSRGLGSMGECFSLCLYLLFFLPKNEATTISGKRVAYILPKEMGLFDGTSAGDWAH